MKNKRITASKCWEWTLRQETDVEPCVYPSLSSRARCVICRRRPPGPGLVNHHGGDTHYDITFRSHIKLDLRVPVCFTGEAEFGYDKHVLPTGPFVITTVEWTEEAGESTVYRYTGRATMLSRYRTHTAEPDPQPA